MTKPTGSRASIRRLTCGKCGAPTRWGEACVLCGAAYTNSEAEQRRALGAWMRYDTPIPTTLRVAHGKTCAYGGEVHECHCSGGVTHPCECYLSPDPRGRRS